MGEQQQVPKWQRLTALAVVVAAVVVVVAFRDRLGADFWPLDRSFVGPNLLASVVQWAVVLLVAALIWPPTRRRIDGFVTGHLKPLHDNHAALLASHEEIQARLDHIIRHHPDLPDFPSQRKD